MRTRPQILYGYVLTRETTAPITEMEFIGWCRIRLVPSGIERAAKSQASVQIDHMRSLWSRHELGTVPKPVVN